MQFYFDKFDFSTTTAWELPQWLGVLPHDCRGYFAASRVFCRCFGRCAGVEGIVQVWRVLCRCRGYCAGVEGIVQVSKVLCRCRGYFAGVEGILQVSRVFCRRRGYFAGVEGMLQASMVFCRCRWYFVAADVLCCCRCALLLPMCFVAKLEKEAYCDEEMAKTEAKPVVHQKSGGAGGSIIGILEVCQRFLKELGYDFLLLHSQMRTRTDPISLGSIGTFGIEDVWQHGSENENDDFAKIKGSRQRHDCQAT